MDHGDLAMRMEGIGKRYCHARIGSQDTSLREQFTAFLRPWRLFLGARRHRKHNDDIVALEPLSLTIPRGQRLGIIGRNGSGKSTLLKILARITPPTSGRVELHGSVAAILEVGTGFHPDLTGAENIYLNGAILGLKRAYVQKHFQEIVAFAELQDFMDVPVKRYSSGMAVRLAFAISAHLQSDILLIDEILAVGDQAFRAKCIARMRAEAERGRTLILVSHHMSDIRMFCDRVVHLHQGRLDFDGDVEEGIARYEHCCGERLISGHV